MPRNRTAPAVTTALPGKSPISAAASVDLPQPAFADDADDLAGFGRDRHRAQRLQGRRAILAAVGDRQARDLDQGGDQRRAHRGAPYPRRGSSASRNPSPRKVKPSVARISGMPAAMIIEGAKRSEV